MRRVNPFDVGNDLDNLYIHLARYMFVCRQLTAKTKVLEIGCGTGYGSRLMANFCGSVVATDNDPALGEYWKKLQQPNLLFTNEIEAGSQFDVIVSFEVIEHIREAELNGFFSVIKKHLATTGSVFLSTPRALPFEQRSKNRQLEHQREYSPSEFRSLLNKHFQHVFIFGQNDGIISTQNQEMAWNLVAICVP